MLAVIADAALLSAAGAAVLVLCIRRLVQHRRAARPGARRPPVAPAISDPAPSAADLAERLVSDFALRPLCDLVDVNRRIAGAQVRTLQELGQLDDRLWHVERDMIFNGHRIPFVAFGPTGIFVLVGSDGAWNFADIAILNDAARRLASTLSKYPVTLRAGIHLPFDADEPRQWIDAMGNNAWVLGHDQLVTWMNTFTGPGLGTGDIAELRRHGGPHWERRQARRLVLSNPATG
jgi:hypothetical protein